MPVPATKFNLRTTHLTKKDYSRPAKTRAKPDRPLVPAAGARSRDQVRIDGGTEKGAVFRQGGVTLVAGRLYMAGGREVVVNGTNVVTLTGVDTFSRMPMLKVVWSQAFANAHVRDNFSAWTAVRRPVGGLGQVRLHQGGGRADSATARIVRGGAAPSSAVPS